MLHPPDIESLHHELWVRHVERCPRCSGTGNILTESQDDPLDRRIGPCECRKLVAYRCAQLESNLPREFWDVEGMNIEHNLDSIDKVRGYCSRLKEVRARGEGLVLWGTNGVGKTTSGAMVVCAALRAGFTAGYVTAPEFITTVVPADQDRELGGWFWGLARADFLVLDELGKEYRKAGSEFARSQMDALIRQRRGSLLPTVLITNYGMEEFQQVYGESITSVVSDRVTILQYEPGDFRKQLALRKRGA